MEYKYTAYWKMFTGEGTQVSFTVAENEAPAHLAALAAYMQAVKQQGYLVQMPGLEDGEKIEDVDAYVLGESSKGDACLFIYAAAHQLQFRVATIYVEKFGDLPFKVTGKKWDATAAPTREEAAKKGYLNTVAPFKIVMEQRGQTEDGKPQWRFVRVHGAPPPPAPAPQQAPDVTDAKPDAAFAALPSATTSNILKRLRQQAAGNKAPADETALKRLIGNVTNIVGGADADRKALLMFLWGHITSKDMTIGEVEATCDWIKVRKDAEGKWNATGAAVTEYPVIKQAIADATTQPALEQEPPW